MKFDRDIAIYAYIRLESTGANDCRSNLNLEIRDRAMGEKTAVDRWKKKTFDLYMCGRQTI